MYIYKKITVIPKIPDRIKQLNDLAYNLWWSWNPHILKIFPKIDLSLWENAHHNPVRFLQQVSNSKLENAVSDQEFLSLYDSIINEFNQYITTSDTWYNENFPTKKDKTIAYFSAEYGLHESLPTYSGGLGVLSGDHCKSASDLGLPFVAVGLFYKQGYFVQQLSTEGRQEAKFIKLNVSELPIKETKDSAGNNIIIQLDFPGRIIYAKVWEVHVGRVTIYMLDTDIPNNNANDRAITSILYGGDQEIRISQEIILGMGGIKMLDSLGIKPTVYHLNEGHSAFCTLEIIRKLIEYDKLSFDSAREVASSATIFTTHTPVSAGSDRFPFFLIDKYFEHILPSLGISREQFINLGTCTECGDVFNMTTFALRMSGQRNGVSKLHGMVSRNIFNNVWKDIPEEEIPITSITNGIHTTTWLNTELRKLLDKYLGDNWINNIPNKTMWNKIENISDHELWYAHMENKKKMVEFARNRLRYQKIRNGQSRSEISAIDKLLDPNALTIGFARRFATYKRASLIFRDIERLEKMISNPAMPIQIIFAGKAHPADHPAQELIKFIHDISQQDNFKGRIFLLENYDMELARHLISGVDIWLNNPRRPLEASGTSGQKAALNGCINFSVLDGWWTEGYNAQNGWRIGEETYYTDTDVQDEIDAQSLYSTLEEQIIPIYYQRNKDDLPTRWVQVMKASIKTCAPLFSTARMVQEYTKDLYIHAIDKSQKITQNNYALSHELTHWKSELRRQWDKIKIIPSERHEETNIIAETGEPVQLNVHIYLENIAPEHIRAEVYYGRIDNNGTLEQPETTIMTLQNSEENNMYLFTGTIHPQTGGEYGYTFRVLPFHTELLSEYDVGLIKWLNNDN